MFNAVDDRAFALGRGEKAVPAATRTKSKMLRNIVKMLWYDYVSWDVIEEDEQKSEEDESLVVIDSPRLLGLLPVLQQLNNKKELTVIVSSTLLVSDGMQALKEHIDIDSTTLGTLLRHFSNHQQSFDSDRLRDSIANGFCVTLGQMSCDS